MAIQFVPKFNGNVQIYYGPPGTGKTTKMLDILEDVLKRARPDEIAYVSFTREGARQGIRRACSRFNYTFKDFPYFRTLHSLAFHALEITKDEVMRPSHYHTFGEAIGMRFAGYYSDELHSPDDRYLFLHDLARNNRAYAEEMFLSEDISIDILKFIFLKFKEFKKDFKLCDYTDMIEQFLKQKRTIPARFVFLDEAQDFTTLQWRMAEQAFRDAEEIYIAGDDDQAIYTWSGADVHAFLEIEGEKHVLDKSHRLPSNILAFAKTITDQITYRAVKDYTGTQNGGSVTYYTCIESVPLDLPGTYMLLVRNVRFMKDIARFLRESGQLYSDKTGASVKPAQISTLRAWEAFWKDGVKLSATDELRIKAATGLDVKDVPKASWLEVFTLWSPEDREYIDRIDKAYPVFEGVEPIFHIATIHTVKGGEADNVVLLLSMSQLTHASYVTSPDPEHRAFYVGATRAKKNLCIVYGDHPTSYDIYPPDIKDAQ